MSKRNFADMIKGLDLGDNPGSCRWVHCNHNSPYKRDQRQEKSEPEEKRK